MSKVCLLRESRYKLIQIAHKTMEGTRIQLKAGGGVSKVIASTLVEVHQVIPLIDEGLVDDVSLNIFRSIQRFADVARYS